jgi:hypothetical protein
MPSKNLEQLGRKLNEETPFGQPETEPQDMEALLETAYNLDQLVQDIMEAKWIGAQQIPPHIMAAGIKLSMGDLEV